MEALLLAAAGLGLSGYGIYRLVNNFTAGWMALVGLGLGLFIAAVFSLN